MIEIPEVMRFATKAHTGQMYGEYPYTTHLSDVQAVMTEFEIFQKKYIAAAWCHDVLEDTENNYNDLKKVVGEEVAEIVYAVTDELGRNREERHKKTWPKIKINRDALIVKLCDMIANVRMGVKEGSSMAVKYKQEFVEFSKYFSLDRIEGVRVKALVEELKRLFALVEG